MVGVAVVGSDVIGSIVGSSVGSDVGGFDGCTVVGC